MTHTNAAKMRTECRVAIAPANPGKLSDFDKACTEFLKEKGLYNRSAFRDKHHADCQEGLDENRKRKGKE